MDISTIVFVALIFLASLLLTLLVRRDFHNKERLRRELRRHVEHARTRQRLRPKL